MDWTLIGVVGVLAIVGVAATSKRLGLAAPLGLVVVGVVLGFVPGIPTVTVPPDVILAGVLPPLLYASAINTPAQDFRRNLRTITSLAVVLVVLTTLATGWLVHVLLPDVGWPAAFALGAVVSPTDAVAATAVGRRLGLPSRLLTILEGEGLVNDASALVLLRAATLAVTTTVSIVGVAGQFLLSVLVATAIGWLVGMVNVRIRAHLPDAVHDSAVSFVVPFVAYLPAEHLHASGVLAVVVAGLVTGHESPRHVSAQSRITTAANWRTVSFLLESGIFFLMGLSLHTVVGEVSAHHEATLGLGRTIAYGLLVTLLVVVVRLVFIGPTVAAVHVTDERASQLVPHLEERMEALASMEPGPRVSPRRVEQLRRRMARMVADVRLHAHQTMGVRGGLVLGWAGMRGAITVAAAQTLDPSVAHRPQLVLIAFVVSLATLLAIGLTLPSVIRVAKVPPDDPEHLREEYAELLGELVDAADAELDRIEREEHPDQAVLDRLRSDSLLRTRVRLARHPEEAEETEDAEAEQAPLVSRREEYLRLRLDVIAALRSTLLEARDLGSYSSRALTQAGRMLDLEETRLTALDE